MFIGTRGTPKDLAPLGAKPGSGTFVESPKAIALLRSFEVMIRTPGYKHLALLGRSDNSVLVYFQLELAQVNHIVI